MKINKRLDLIGEYHFKDLDIIKKNAIKKGIDVIDLSIGDPDLPVNKNILDGLVKGFSRRRFNNYPPYEGTEELKEKVREYYKNVYNVDLDLDEILILIGCKEGINNLIPAVCDFGDFVIVPEPGYPVYKTSPKIWGNQSYTIPLERKNNFLPCLKDIPDNIRDNAKLFFINYPNNPTGASANKEFFEEIIEYCSKNDIVLCNDGAYMEMVKYGNEPISLLQFDYDKKFIEFGSFSKTFNMSGFRLGYAVGNKDIIQALLKIKSNVDSGQFIPIQDAGVCALELNRDYIVKNRAVYDERRKVAERLLEEKGISFYRSEGTFYIWCDIPQGCTPKEFYSKLINNYGILVTPGEVFGSMCYNNFRISLTKDVTLIQKGLNRIDKFDR